MDNNIYGVTKKCTECFDLHQNIGLICTNCLSKINNKQKKERFNKK